MRLLPPRKFAAIDEPDRLMNFHSFKESITHRLHSMEEDECSILIMIDGDRFKAVNDNYGHSVGMKSSLCAQMIIGRIRPSTCFQASWG
ncbi:MAG: diguanylate cyclase domain-containing protein [[Clostridium] scindens]